MTADANPTKILSPAEQRRLERFERGRQNRRGRIRPASVPARLARTSAFAPKRRGLITDSGFKRLYVVPRHSVIEVTGRELGSQHRDAIYAVFRLKRTKHVAYPANAFTGTPVNYEAVSSWRELLLSMGRKEHPNNLLTLLGVFQDIAKVVFTIYEGNPDDVLRALKLGRLGGSNGMMGSLINEVVWDGVDLDSRVVVKFGSWSVAMIEKAKLVSLNAEVQFRLKSDHAKSFWPYIDSMNDATWVDEDTLASLVGRDLWVETESKDTRGQFRKDCRQAFNDMVRAGGLAGWRDEVLGSGRMKRHRYHYQHALVRQMELDLNARTHANSMIA